MHVSRRRLGIGVVVGSLAVPGGLGAAPRAAPPSLRAVEIDFTRLSPLTRATLRSELGQVLAPVPLRMSWRTAATGDETAPDELSFVFLPSAGVGGDRGALASTANHDVVRTTWVYVPNVASALGLDLEAVVTSFDAQRLLGLALGRVLAHEIVHAIAPDVEHASAGLMRPGLDAFQLVRCRPALEARDSVRLAARARAWLADAAERVGSDHAPTELAIASGR